MQQLEIQFFFPLTEQIPLDLDYTQPEKPKVWNTGAASGTFLIANGGGGTTWSSIPNITSTFEFKSNPDVQEWKLFCCLSKYLAINSGSLCFSRNGKR